MSYAAVSSALDAMFWSGMVLGFGFGVLLTLLTFDWWVGDEC